MRIRAAGLAGPGRACPVIQFVPLRQRVGLSCFGHMTIARLFIPLLVAATLALPAGPAAASAPGSVTMAGAIVSGPAGGTFVAPGLFVVGIDAQGGVITRVTASFGFQGACVAGVLNGSMDGTMTITRSTGANTLHGFHATWVGGSAGFTGDVVGAGWYVPNGGIACNPASLSGTLWADLAIVG